jgi:predicted Rossmann-fold nucleotide-binding protein
MTIYYAGIGARKTNSKYLSYITSLGKYFAQKGYVLRSGGANGADSAFEEGCDLVNGQKEIYLPWCDFNNNKSSLYDLPNFQEAFKIAESFHPAWYSQSQAVKKLHTRNSYQVLGSDLQTPSLFVVCYTDGTGGTMQALRIAKSYNIPVFNLKLEKNLFQTEPDIYGEYIESKVGLMSTTHR